MATSPAANKTARAGLSTRPSCSQASRGPYRPTKIASRRMTTEVAGGLVGNLLLRKATIGRAVPVRAITPRKKNSQRGPTVGSVYCISQIRPPQPATARMMAVGRKELTEGVERVSMERVPIIIKKPPAWTERSRLGDIHYLRGSYSSRNWPSMTSPSSSSLGGR